MCRLLRWAPGNLFSSWTQAAINPVWTAHSCLKFPSNIKNHWLAQGYRKYVVWSLTEWILAFEILLDIILVIKKVYCRVRVLSLQYVKIQVNFFGPHHVGLIVRSDPEVPWTVEWCTLAKFEIEIEAGQAGTEADFLIAIIVHRHQIGELRFEFLLKFTDVGRLVRPNFREDICILV